MTSEKAPDLDLTALLAQPVMVKAGEKTFSINTDLPPTLLFDIQRWFGKVRGRSSESDSSELNEEAAELTAKALAIPVDEARALGGSAQIRLLDFLSKFPWQGSTTRS